MTLVYIVAEHTNSGNVYYHGAFTTEDKAKGCIQRIKEGMKYPFMSDFFIHCLKVVE